MFQQSPRFHSNISSNFYPRFHQTFFSKYFLGVIGIVASMMSSVAAHAYDCTNVTQYAQGNVIATGKIVKNINNAYECTVGGWCSIGGPYEPGIGWAESNAWKNLGSCTASNPASVKSSANSISSALSSAVVSISSATFSSVASSSSATGNGYLVVDNRTVTFFANNAPWVDIHYVVAEGIQQNIRMTPNADNTNVYTLNNIPAGAVVKYFFTIGTGAGGQTDTVWKQFSCCGAASSISSLSSVAVSSTSSVLSSVSSSSSSSFSSSAPASSKSSATSSVSSVALGNIVPLFNNSTALENVIQFDRGDALVTRFSDRARDRHAKENHFQAHDHYLPFYWENRTASIEIVDYVAKGGSSIRMNVTTLSKLDDLQAENRWWYVGDGTLAEFCGNGVMNVIDQTHYWKESSTNCRENLRPIKIGDKLEIEVSQFMDKATLPRGRDHYYGSTFLYIVGKGLVPWDVTDMNPYVPGKTFQRDSIEMPESAQLGGIHSLNRQTSAEPADHFMQMAYGLGYENGQPFVLGRRLAHTEFTNGHHDESEENGVFNEMVGKSGPNYVNSACVQCHTRNGRAPVAAVGEPLVKWVFKVGDAAGNASPTIGRVLQPNNVNGTASGEGSVSISSFTDVGGLQKPNFQFERGAPAAFSARIAPQIVGMGLLEAIPESAILANVDENDANGDGISGRAQKITDPVTGEVRLGRFGYKATATSVRHQVAAALNTDMGVTTSVLPKPDCGSSQSNCGATGVELSDTHLDNLTKYIALLGVRSQRDYGDAQVIKGKSIFSSIGCAGCHTDTFKTSSYTPFAELRNQNIHPYTDMLLHDMGPGLADSLPEGQASGSEWRTPPLWGIGLSPCVTGGVSGPPNTDGLPYGVDGKKVCTPSANYLHDGRARNLDEAIRWHGGEGLKAEQAYERLSTSDKDALLKFGVSWNFYD
ncbi:MAG: hypothetical protein EOO94_00830 [Pedobacter sp.]|nr:MAG: hypothetical protein EOO94_00830 [Pedobacter sp.]